MHLVGGTVFVIFCHWPKKEKKALSLAEYVLNIADIFLNNGFYHSLPKSFWVISYSFVLYNCMHLWLFFSSQTCVFILYTDIFWHIGSIICLYSIYFDILICVCSMEMEELHTEVKVLCCWFLSLFVDRGFQYQAKYIRFTLASRVGIWSP